MSNKISVVMDALETALGGLVTDGVLKAVARGVIDPLTEPNTPKMSILIEKFWRESTTWFAQVLVMLAAVRGGDAPEDVVIEICAAADAKITELIEAGTAGGVIDQPKWEVGLGLAQMGTGGQLTPGIGTLRIRVEGPLLIPEE